MTENITYKQNHRYIGALHDISSCEECSRPVISKAQYSKNMYAVHCPSDKNSIFKTKNQMIASHITQRYSHREHAWIMTKGQINKFIKEIYPIESVFFDHDEDEQNNLKKLFVEEKSND